MSLILRRATVALVWVGAGGLGCADPCEDDGWAQDGACNQDPDSTGQAEGEGSDASGADNADADAGTADGTAEGGDADADGTGDDGDTVEFCRDEDGDGWGNPEECVEGDPDEPPDGHVPNDDDCDDAIPSPENVCEALDVETQDACVEVGESMTDAQLVAIATGGDGNYVYAWTPMETLDDAAIADPLASPAATTTYTVTVTDGTGATASDFSTVVSTAPLDLEADCELIPYDLGDENPPSITFQEDGTRVCELINGDAGVFTCPIQYENISLRGEMVVERQGDDNDNDNIGFLWGIEDMAHFYVFVWKQQDQVNDTLCPNTPGNLWPGGMMVKRIEADAPEDVTGEDLFCLTDTERATMLLEPSDLTTAGWVFDEPYDVLLEYTTTGTRIEITRQSDGTTIASFDVEDSTYPNGRFGTLTFSQTGACNGPWIAACI